MKNPECPKCKGRTRTEWFGAWYCPKCKLLIGKEHTGGAPTGRYLTKKVKV